jgi:hypothetical protein
MLRQRPQAGIRGFTDQRWSGATTLQWARLCEAVVTRGLFDRLRAESPVHHVCPNEAVTKYQLLVHLRDCYRPDLDVAPAESGHPVRRELATELAGIPAILGTGGSLAGAVRELRDFFSWRSAAAPCPTSA